VVANLAARRAGGGATGADRAARVAALTYASLLIHHGESVKVVQRRLGHSSAGITLDTYAHLWPDSDDRTRDAVEAALSAVADPVRTERVQDGL
jgi:integrase